MRSKSFFASRKVLTAIRVAKKAAKRSVKPQKKTAEKEVVLHIDRKGTIRSFHTEVFPMHKLGKIHVERLSHVDFNYATQRWEVWNADHTKVLFRNISRAKCLAWEEKHFKHDLMKYLTKKAC